MAQAAFTTEEIDLANWLSDPEAKSILRSCALNAPAWERHVRVYALTRDEWYTASGPRADRLREIHSRYAQQTYDHCVAIGDYELMRAFFDLPKVDQAIEAMVSAAPLIRSAKIAAVVVHQARAA